ncbi:MAG TPA: TonB-dependent receptor [Puia sp.]|uniref:TonB-dependent receptor n=1 Tax=Puia sp. TaxID=2045100 RepID=UPI002B9A656A|nr:TonB-dependent receptor [Puia sp.]HVU94227.1 TonB-dependent receptor [Puia sp.]
MKWFATLILLVFVQSGFAQNSGVRGIITGANHEPLAGAYLSINGTHLSTTTDAEGHFVFPRLKPGEYTITVEFIGHKTLIRKIVAGPDEQVDLKMERGDASLEEVRVFGRISQEEEAGSRQKEKHANNIVNVISAQAMERSPDINAANVLQRMSGLTIQRNGGSDEAYPIVRGLDPRYNNTLINGIKIAGPDDKSRYVPLNIVPSDLLGSIEVHKSLLPEMEGDAIGGSVNMVMKDAPDRPVFKVLGSVGYSKIFLDRKFQNFSKADIRQKSLNERFGPEYTAQPGDFSRSNLDFTKTQPLPNTVGAITWGRRFADGRLGVLVAGNFQDQYYGSDAIYNQAAPNVHANGAPGLSDYANRYFSTHQMNNGVTLHLDYNLNPRNKITLTNILLYTYIAQARTIIDTAILGGNGGRTVPGTGPVTTDYTSVTSGQWLENIKLEGKHILNRHLLADWTGVFSYAAKRSPDMADLSLNSKIDTVHTTGDIHGPYNFVVTPNYFDDITRIWQHNHDQDIDGMLNLTWRSALRSTGTLELKGGGLYRHKTRFNRQDEYDLRPTTDASGVKQVFTDINTAGWTVYNTSGTYDYDLNNYRLHEDITAGYGEVKLSFPRLDLFGGARVEHTDQGYKLNTPYATGINEVDKDYTDVLPSVMAKVKLNDRTNLRLSYFKGIARPNYYDLVPATRFSVTSANSTTGNPYLNHTTSDNYDLRYEWYPRPEEQLFAGVFYKRLVNPIENAYISGTVDKPQNFGNATDYGAELVFTRYFGRIGVTGNYTYLYSKIYSNKSYYNLVTGYSNPDTLQKRSLQGQTDHTLNLSLLYKDTRRAMFAELAFQYIGKSISVVYPIYGYDYYQQPQANLAFSAEKGLHNRHFTLFTKWNNLLNTPYKAQINDLLVQREITKFNASIGLRYSN